MVSRRLARHLSTSSHFRKSKDIGQSSSTHSKGTGKKLAVPSMITIPSIEHTDELSTSTRGEEEITSAPASPHQEEPHRSKKSISFNPRVAVRTTLHLRNYTAEEREAAWYTCFEVEELRALRKDTVLQLVKGVVLADVLSLSLREQETAQDRLCVWGLESHIDQSKRSRYLQSKQTRKVVLQMQTDQRNPDGSLPDMLDWETISAAYMTLCWKTHKTAMFIGENYAKTVKQENTSHILALKEKASSFLPSQRPVLQKSMQGKWGKRVASFVTRRAPAA